MSSQIAWGAAPVPAGVHLAEKVALELKPEGGKELLAPRGRLTVKGKYKGPKTAGWLVYLGLPGVGTRSENVGTSLKAPGIWGSWLELPRWKPWGCGGGRIQGASAEDWTL